MVGHPGLLEGIPGFAGFVPGCINPETLSNTLLDGISILVLGLYTHDIDIIYCFHMLHRLYR